MEKIMKARLSVILREPFFASLMLKRPLIADESIKTTETDGDYIKYNPAYIEGLSHDQIQTVLIHNILHIANFHHLRRAGRNEEEWNKACVAPDTLILMANGTQKPISAIQIGDKIWGWENGSLKESEVLDTFSKLSTFVEISLHNGYELTCTPDHEILTKEGYIESQYTKGKAAQVVRIGKGIYQKEFEQPDNAGNGNGIKRYLQANRFFPLYSWLIRTAQNFQAQKFEEPTYVKQNRFCLFSWYSGWRRNNIYLQKGRQLLSSIRSNCYHFFCTCKVVQSNRVLWHNCKEQQPAALLENNNQWFSNFGTTGKDSAIPYNKKGTRNTLNAVHPPTIKTEQINTAHGGNENYLPTDKRIKYSRIKNVRRIAGEQRVFDLTTTTHSYIANGIIVHNCDYAINPILKQCKYELPKDALLNDSYKDMPAEGIYSLIMAKKQEQQPAPKAGEGNNATGPQQGPQSQAGMGDVTDQKKAKTQTEVAEQESKLKQELAQSALTAKQQGKLPQFLEIIINELLENKVDWEAVLSRFVSDIVKNDYSWKKPNTRYLHTGFYLPSLYNVELKNIAFAVDTSGSVDKDILSKCSAGIKDAADIFKANVTVMYCNTEITKVEEFTADDEMKLNPKGKGGTDFRPPFKYLDDEGITPPCLIYLTDGMCDKFPPEPDYPVLWVIYGGTKFNAPFGEIIYTD